MMMMGRETDRTCMMMLITKMPVELQLRAVRWLGDEGRERVRQTSRGLRDLVRLWEETQEELRLFRTVRFYPDVLGSSSEQMIGTAMMAPLRMLHVVCSLPTGVEAFIKRSMGRLTQDEEAQFFVERRDDWSRAMRRMLTVLTQLEEAGQLAAVRCWRMTLVLPVYGRAPSPDHFLRSADAIRLLAGLTGLESVTLQLCAPHDHFNTASGRVCCPAHGPQNLGRSTLLQVLVMPALPLWGRLKELVLTDLSFRGTRNQVELVHVLVLALTRDAALATRLVGLSGAELHAALAAEPPRAGCLERLELKGVMLSGERWPLMLFWLTVCAFVPGRRLQLTATGIPWPAADYVYPATGTLFPPWSYGYYSGVTQKKPVLDLEDNKSMLRPLIESRIACTAGVEVRLPF